MTEHEIKRIRERFIMTSTLTLFFVMLIMGGSVYLFSTIAIRNEAQQIMRYIAENDGDLPKPEMREIFPINYPDYHYWEGIGEEVSKYKWHSGESFF